jgi:hypothetical protein
VSDVSSAVKPISAILPQVLGIRCLVRNHPEKVRVFRKVEMGPAGWKKAYAIDRLAPNAYEIVGGTSQACI